jgi:hypothetical protein
LYQAVFGLLVWRKKCRARWWVAYILQFKHLYCKIPSFAFINQLASYPAQIGSSSRFAAAYVARIRDPIACLKYTHTHTHTHTPKYNSASSFFSNSFILLCYKQFNELNKSRNNFYQRCMGSDMVAQTPHTQHCPFLLHFPWSQNFNKNCLLFPLFLTIIQLLNLPLNKKKHRAILATY